MNFTLLINNVYLLLKKKVKLNYTKYLNLILSEIK